MSQGPAVTVGDSLNPPPSEIASPDFQSKVVMWSYPIIDKGLICVIDIRNGVYILKYTDPQANQVRGTEFLAGNSNLGSAIELDQ